ncbi:MAG: hypothetical protein KDA58_11920, partial [Planctomycetaceae bacterium]|nr:hypothetical protein [Planctomycetaceae bacterium]
VERAYVRTRFAENGLSEVVAMYDLVSPPSRIVLQLPRGTAGQDVRRILIDGEVLGPEAVSMSETEVRLSLDSGTAETARLVIEYRNQLAQSFGLSRLEEVEFLRFPASVWVNETHWEFQLPFGQHLFAYPQTLFPRFHWKPRGLFWFRVLTPEYLAEREAWQLPEEAGAVQGAPVNAYAFRGIGPIAQVHMRSMSRSLILLIGAGTSLALGFLFWQFPFTRNVFSIVLLAFAFSVASLWFLEPMQLLLQPALLGLAFAALATFLEGGTRQPAAKPTQPRNQRPSTVTNHGHSLPASPDSATRIPSTIHRPSP